MYVTGTVFHHHALSGPVIIKTTNQFAEYPDSIVQNIPVIYLPALQHHIEHRENSVYIKGTCRFCRAICFGRQGFPLGVSMWGDNLGKMAKNCMKITKSTVGNMGEQTNFSGSGFPLGETLEDEIDLVFYMTSISTEPLTDIEYSKIKTKSTYKASKLLEQAKGRIKEKLKNQIENVAEPTKKYLI